MYDNTTPTAGFRVLRPQSWTLVLLLVFSVRALGQSGGGYDLSWNTTANGGGVSTGGGFELSGTIGRPDTSAAMLGGNYALTGGFWIGMLPPVCTEFAAADFDRDCDVDLDDLMAFQACMSGPALPFGAGCEGKDLDHDGDADQQDFGLLQGCYSGANKPVDPGCTK